MNLVIDGNITYPPSEISCVRDVTLYSVVWSDYDVLVTIMPEYKDHLWYYLRSTGTMDYVEDIIAPDQEPGVKISDDPDSNICVKFIGCENLSYIISRLKRFN